MLLIQQAPDKYVTVTCNSTGIVCCCVTVLVVIVSEVGSCETLQLRDGYCKHNGDNGGMIYRFSY